MITLTREEAQQVLDALKEYVSTVKSEYNHHSWDSKIVDAGQPARRAIETIRTRLAQPEPEPVAWRFKIDNAMYRKNVWHVRPHKVTHPDAKIEPLYTASPQRKKEYR